MIISLIAILVFGVIYGYRVVNPTYTDWLYVNGGDLAQGQYGWEGFRADKRRFPIGLYRTFSYPSEESLLWSDSLPCLAIFFKLIKGILPEDFQYLGLWGLTSFILTGIFAYKITEYSPESAWTDGEEMIMAMKLDSVAPLIYGQIDINNVYMFEQNVQIYVNDTEVFNENVKADQGTINFWFENPGEGEEVTIRLRFPDCDSPLNRGESDDDRMLCLSISRMRFLED